MRDGRSLRSRTVPIKAHVETIHENGVDTAHFGIVHGFFLSEPAYDDRGPSFHSEFHFATPNFLREGPDEIATFFDTDTYGLGYAHSLNTAEAVGLRYRVLLLTTPTTLELVDFTIATTVQRPESGDLIGGVEWTRSPTSCTVGRSVGSSRTYRSGRGCATSITHDSSKETDRSPASATGHDNSIRPGSLVLPPNREDAVILATERR